MGMMVSPEYGGGGMDTVFTFWQWKKFQKLMHRFCNTFHNHWYVGESKNLEMKNKAKYSKPLASGELLVLFVY